MYYCIVLFSVLILPLKVFAEGRLIEVCGIDGSGKSTFIQDIKDALIKKGKKVIVIRPLSGDPAIYKCLEKLDTLARCMENTKLQERVDRFKSDYFLLEMLTHKPLIDHYISEGYDVLCDRYVFSYKTYQECFNQDSKEYEALLCHLPTETITFLLTVPIEVAINRIEAKGPPAPYENPTFLRKAQEIFLREADCYPHLVLINGSATRKANIDEALSALGEQ